MKRIHIISIVICVLLMVVLAIPTLAAQSATVSVSSSNTVANRGETITITVSTSAVENCTSGGFMFTFDKNVFEYVSGESLSGVSGYTAGVSTAAGNIAGYFMNGNATVQEKIFQITLKIKETAELGTYTISGTPSLTATDGSVSCSVESVSVTVACSHSFTKEDNTYLKSEATCTSPALYYKSCVICGEKGTETFEYGETTEHSYTRQVTSDTYKVSDATCSAEAVYKYCCATCDKAGSETFKFGTITEHLYTRKVVTDTYKVSDANCTNKAVYNYCCVTCDKAGTETYENGNELGHTGGTATCTTKAECTRCHQLYGDMLEHNYTDEDATDIYLKSGATCTSKAIYYKNCSVCDKAGSVTFEHGDLKSHTYIEKIENTYLKTEATCTSKAVYYKSCSACGIKGTDTFNAGDAPSHSYQTTWSHDKNSHWHACSKCGDKKDMATHTAGTAATENTAQICTVCEYIITPELGHTHKYSSELSSDINGHWFECEGCGDIKDYSAHTYENACDVECNDCKYTRSTTHNLENIVNDQTKKSDATCIAKAIYYKSCSECGYISNETFEHGSTKEHSFDNYVFDNNATCENDGTKTAECNTCGTKDTVTADGTKLAHQFENGACKLCGEKDSAKSNNTTIIIIVAVSAAVIIGGSILTVIIIKKRKNNE